MAERAPDEPGMIPQPHGGALLRGGKRGNKGGPGRPPSAVRRLCLGAFANRVVHLRAIADGVAIEEVRSPDGKVVYGWKSAEIPDRLKALDMLAKYGMGPQTTVSDVRERLAATLTLLDGVLAAQPALLAQVRDGLEGIWR